MLFSVVLGLAGAALAQRSSYGTTTTTAAPTYTCPELSCKVECLVPVKDEYGCATCQCDWCDSFTAKSCGVQCEFGYDTYEFIYDGIDSGMACPLCKCAESAPTETDTYTETDFTYTEKDSNETYYEDYTVWNQTSDDSGVSAQDLTINLKKMYRVQNIVARHMGPEWDGIDAEEVSKEVEHRKKEAFESLDKETQEKAKQLQNRYQNTPPWALIAIKRNQVKEEVNRTTGEYIPEDFDFVAQLNATLHANAIAIKKHINSAEETPIYDAVLALQSMQQEYVDQLTQYRKDTLYNSAALRQERRFTRRDFFHSTLQNAFETITDAFITQVIKDDARAKEAREAVEQWESMNHYGLVLYRQYVKHIYENKEDFILSDAERSALKKFVVTQKAYMNSMGYDIEDLAVVLADIADDLWDAFFDELAVIFEYVNKRWGTDFKVDPKTEERIQYRFSEVSRSPIRALYIATHETRTPSARG